MKLTEFQKSQQNRERLGLAIAAYSAGRLKNVDSNIKKVEANTAESAAELRRLNTTATELKTLTAQQTAIQQSLDFTLKSLERVSNEQLSLQRETISQIEKQNRLLEIDLERRRLKDEREELRETQLELEREQLKQMRATIHMLNRQATNIIDSDYTTLEKSFLLNKLREAIAFVSAEDFDEIPDKQFRDATEDLIAKSLAKFSSEMNSVDKAELARLVELERVDEDRIAQTLLDNCKLKLEEHRTITEVKRLLGRQTEISDALRTKIISKLQRLKVNS